MKKYEHYQNIIVNSMVDHDINNIRIVAGKLNSELLFSGDEYQVFEKVIKQSIDLRNHKNTLKRINGIKKYRRNDEDSINKMAMWGEQLINLLLFRMDFHNIVDQYEETNVATFAVSKGCDIKFRYDKKDFNYEIKSTTRDVLNINDLALKHCESNACHILAIKFDFNQGTFELFKMTTKFFRDNAEYKDGQNGSGYYSLPLIKLSRQKINVK